MRQGTEPLPDGARVGEMLKAFCACVSLPVQRIDEQGIVVEAYGEANGYCRLLGRHVLSFEACREAHIDAARHALTVGEAYVFACPASLNLIAFPLSNQDTLAGAILVGPFLLDVPDSTLIAALSERRPLSPTALLDLYDGLSSVRVVTPEHAGQIGRLLYFLLSSLVPAQRRQWARARETLYQQARIGETIQLVKAHGAQGVDAYPYEKEKELLTKVRTGDAQAAKGVLNDLLGYVFFCEGGRVETMKNRALELCTLLSRIAIEGGAVTDSVFRLNNQFLTSLQAIDTLEALCYQLQEIVEAFVDAMFAPGGQPGHDAVRKAVTYIARHFAEPLALDVVAAHVGLSRAYFSNLFKRSTGSSFREFLNQVRVEESKRLLTGTDFALVDIAIAMGFSDQSYYSKVFKKYTGLTPKQYR